MDMRSLYPVRLPRRAEEFDDEERRDEWVAKNENCLNQNFALLAEKIYEFEARLNALEE